MFRRIHNDQKKDQQPAAKDENVRKETQLEEDQNFIQPMSNEAANYGPHLPNGRDGLNTYEKMKKLISGERYVFEFQS